MSSPTSCLWYSVLKGIEHTHSWIERWQRSWPIDAANSFPPSVLKGVTVTDVGNAVQIDTKLFGRSESGPASISIEI